MNWTKSFASLNLSTTDAIAEWLRYEGSLTEVLKNQAAEEQLDLRLLHQNWRIAYDDELQRLGVSAKDAILERIISMSVADIPWLYARSYFSKFAADYFGKDLINLGNNFLGELMTEKYPELYQNRSSFEFAYVLPNDAVYLYIKKCFSKSKIELGSKLIARRSLFKLDSLVLFNLDEIFLPALIEGFKIKVNAVR